MRKMEVFLDSYGLRAQPEDMREHVMNFIDEMHRGLAGQSSSLQMLPTYVRLDGRLDAGRPVIVIDAGGTNLRIALVALRAGGVPEILYFEKYPMLGTQGRMSAEEFYDTLASYLAPVAGRADCIGVCFSFPAEILPGGDARVLYFDKEVCVDGAENTVIGQRLLASLRKQNLPHHLSVTVINDTVASLLGARADGNLRDDFSSYIGLILGTGINSAYIEQNANITKSDVLVSAPGETIINLESGGFSGMPLSRIDKDFIAGTEEPDAQLMEKLSSGAYQADLLWTYARAAAEEGCFSPEFAQRIGQVPSVTGKDIDIFCDFPHGDGAIALLCATEEDRADLYRLCDAFFDRVALCAATNLTALLQSLGERAKNPCRPVCISAEGTTFYKARLLRPKLDYFLCAYTERELGLHHRFVRVENATILGTAVAGLLGGC